MVGSTASIRQVEAALRNPPVAAIWAAHSVVLAAAVVMSYPVVGREAIMKGLCRFPNSWCFYLGRCQGRRYRCGSCPTVAIHTGHSMASAHWVKRL